MDPVKKDASVEDEKDLEKDKKSEDVQDKDEFEKKEEFVPAGKYNEAVRKQRELELKLHEAQEGKGEKPVKKEVVDEDEEADEEEDEDFEFDEEDDEEEKEVKPKKKPKKSTYDDPIRKELEEVKSRLDQKEAEDRKAQRTRFFKAHPEYLSDSEKWTELLDELDTSINPHSKLTYYQQLTKAHLLVSGGSVKKTTLTQAEIEKKKADLAAEASGKGDGSQKPANNNGAGADDRALRLAKNMPKGYKFTIKEE